MSADESAVMVVLPDDTLDTLVRKIHTTSARCIQLLVPERISLLHSAHVVDALRRSLEPNQLTLIVISSDKQTLDTARKFELETIAVYGTHVEVADITTASPLPAAPPAPPRPSAPPVPARKAPEPDTDYDPFADELDSLSDIWAGRASSPDETAQAETAFADELDSLSDMVADGDSRPAAPARQSNPATSAAAPPPPTSRPPRRYCAQQRRKRACLVGAQRRRAKKERRQKEKTSPCCNGRGNPA